MRSNAKPENNYQNMPDEFWGTVFYHARPHRRALTVAIVSSALVGIAVALQPITIKFIVDSGILRPEATPGERMGYAAVFSLGYLMISLSRVSVWLFGYRRMVVAIEGMIFNLRESLFQHVQHLCFRFHERVTTGEIFNYLMGSPVNSLKGFFHAASMNIPYQVVTWTVSLGALAYFDLVMTGIVMATIGVIILVNHRSQ
ncbi:MAG: hypothetical protein HQL31_05445, partial [Planctomycetes bacterium]|nr:hypothetical protein [Planctomycetota bacterium]